MKLLSIIASVLLRAAGSTGQSSAIWNTGSEGSNTLVDYSNTLNHINGLHFMDAWETGSCHYANTSMAVGSPCIATARAFDTPTVGDTGSVSPTFYKHVYSGATAGSVTSNTGSVSTPASAAMVIASCLFGNCSLTISTSAAGVVSTSISGSGTLLWQFADTYNAYCQAEVMGCPIIIDTMGEGFQLTDAADGVVTDMVIPGRQIRFGWTKPGSHNAFLWLDGHLFGNSTPQPPSDDPNGFAALAVYDSNHDGVIDASDPVFSQLRLWIDSNHDGVAQPQELFTLPSLGVYSISLQHKVDKYRDQYGNLFHYRGHLQKTRDTDRTIYDVYLATDIRKPNVAINDTLH